MNKSDLIQILVDRHPLLSRADVAESVATIIDAMSSVLERHGRIEIRGFGSFANNYRPPRRGRNPKTGEPVLVPEKYVPHFKPGKDLRERVDRSFRTE